MQQMQAIVTNKPQFDHLLQIQSFILFKLLSLSDNLMSEAQAKQIQMLNEYIAALQRQIKSIENQRQSLINQVTKSEMISNKSNEELRNLKSQLRQLNAVLYRQTVDKTNVENQLKFVQEENEKLKKQCEYKQQKISQMTHTITEKTDLLAKEKNNHYLTTTYHSKQMAGMEEKLKELERRLGSTLEQKIFLNTSLSETEELLSKEKEEKTKLLQKVQFLTKQVQVAEFKASAFEQGFKQASEARSQLEAKINKTLKQVQSKKQQISRLELQVASRSQSNEEARKSFEALVDKLQKNHSSQVAQLSAKIDQKQKLISDLETEITQLKQSNACLKSQLSEEKNNFVNEFQKNTQLSKHIIELNIKIDQLKTQMQEQLSHKNSFLEDKEKQFLDLLNKSQQLQFSLQEIIKDKNESQANLNQKYEALENKTKQELNRKEAQLEELKDHLSVKTLQISQLRTQIKSVQGQLEAMTQQYSQKKLELEKITHEHQLKVQECQTLNLKMAQLFNEISDLKETAKVFYEEKNGESTRLRAKLQILNEELVEARKKEAKLAKSLKETEEKLAKAMEQLSSMKESGDKKQSELKKRINELEKEVEKAKEQISQKDSSLQNISSENEFKIKECLNKQQELSKRCNQAEAKYAKIKAKLAETQKDLDSKDTMYNRQIEKLILEHKNELKLFKNASEEHLASVQAKLNEEISSLTLQLEEKETLIRTLQSQLQDEKELTQNRLSSNLQSIEKKSTILQVELDDYKRQLASAHENLIALENNLKKNKEKLLEKDIKIEALNLQLEKAKQQNNWLTNEADVLRAQIQALENSTLYLKKQISSTLEQQQKSLKEIRSLKEANRQLSKLTTSGVRSPRRTSRERSDNSGVLEGTKSGFSIEGGVGKSETNGEIILGSVAQRRIYGSSYRKGTRILQKYLTASSVPSKDIVEGDTSKKQMQACKDTEQEPEFMPPEISSSSYYMQENQK